MPLTDLVITADCQRHGWLDHAAREACRQLTAQGRPQIAAHLARRFARQPSLETLQGSLRVELATEECGCYAARAPLATHGGGELTQWHSGRVPLKPKTVEVARHAAHKDNWVLPVAARLVASNTQGPILYGYAEDEAGAWRLDWQREEERPWSAAATDGTFLVATMALTNGVLLLHGLDPQTGETLWSGPMAHYNSNRSDPEERLLLIDGKVVVYDPVDGVISAYDAQDGRSLWVHHTQRRQLDLELRSAGDRLVVLLPRQQVYALDLNEGHLLWQRPTGETPEIAFCTPSHLYLCRRTSGLACFCLDTGALALPHATLGELFGQERTLERTALVCDGQTAFWSGSGVMMAARLKGAHGALWARELERGTLADRVLIVGETAVRVRGMGVNAYNLQTGQPLWEKLPISPAGLRGIWGMPQGILVWTAEHRLHLIRENARP